ncbi:hypothetical protein lillamy94_gp042 [Flavobacterium phage vB_FspS_lillamy9-4]|uniref:DUF3127 domain-containing protein n=7 Tax=Caudoviricetes TaxID=2731619 RepID=A0A6B9LCK7_9CAUD|nr:single strand DNA binding protein [Flavobacterium phage vB_FspS_filifjonk9-1]YP_009854897.1 single strand DNA binding protein [Flavobacterium phage vB_FspS_lillamy9-1]QHB39143.1 hypothetical protein lillamy92_gp042 [Flavobacterium phage vB_FspS_lillamy9-2]QHB39216.1 hypothetical protein lillamy93_gp042 [Flavobacterium phage vB_FspS_lillamy9-3]QHB39289.1 hypothetical protein lillamy94_gp042 [Flavobacterium phage vB_FspS_lillamy9-4]QHB39362.1 hypothetical protein lillamy95_gp042 [Flavobacteri
MSEVIGKVILVGNTEEVGQNGFTKRVIVVETAEQYPQKLAIDFVKDKTSLLDKFKVGDNVSVGINLRGSEYNGRYFVNLQGWRISNNSETTAPSIQQVKEVSSVPSGDDSGLPF